MQLSRREFLVAANAAALLALLESCVSGAASHFVATPTPAGGDPYERALRLMRDAVRASPDHLSMRSNELVAAKDASRIVEFVRDRVSVVPPWSFLDDHRSARRWGSAATLRGGQGTLRDRAELLADMLTRAGFKAQVMTADRPASIGLADLYGVRTVPFSPDQKAIDQAIAVLVQAGVPAPPAPTATATQTGDPTAAILAALPDTVKHALVREDLLPPKVPLVAYDDGGRKRYALALGSAGVVDAAPSGLASAPTADAAPAVTITVSAIANPAIGSSTPRGNIIDLVSGKWAADQVVGRQVLLTFIPQEGPKACLQHGLSAHPVRLPILRVQTDTPSDPTTGLVATGQLITVRGDQFPPATASGGDFEGPYGTLRALSDAERASAASRAAIVKATANASAFPEVALDVAVADGAGAPIDGLDARSFTVQEDGSPVAAFTVLSNVAVQRRPRVMIAYDTSGSVLRAWPTTAARQNFERALSAAIAGAAAEVPFDAQVVQLGSKPDPRRWAPPDAAVVAAGMTGTGSSDETWGTLAGPALDQGLAAIIYVGDSSDESTRDDQLAALQRRLAASGVPVFCIPTGPVPGPSTAKIVSLSGGAQLDRNDPSTPAKIAALIKPYARTWVGGAYRLSYQAVQPGAAKRAVTVAIAGHEAVHGQASYQVPAQPVSPPSFAGLYMTIAVGSVRSFRRLAGLELSFNGAILGDLDDPAAVAETRAAMDGVTTIAVEPGTPTTAAVFDDVISSYLSIAPLRPIWKTASVDQLLAGFAKGVHRTPLVLGSVLPANHVDRAAVPVFKVAILQERLSAAGLVEQHLDLAIGANPVVAITTDPRQAFNSAVATSAAACAAEATALDDSAYQRLSGKSLIAIPVSDFGAYNSFFNGVPADRQARWKTAFRVYADQHVVAPVGAGTDAFWVVDPGTGVAKAVLLDGTGGAVGILACELSGPDIFSLVLSALGMICTIGGGAINPWFCLGVTVASVITTGVIIFQQAGSSGTPYGSFATAFGAGGTKSFALGGRLGIAGVVVGLTLISLEC